MPIHTISTIPEVRVELRPSKIVSGEVGLYATRTLKKDTVVLPYKAFSDVYFVSWSNYKKLDAITKKKVMDYCPGTAEGFYTPRDFNYLTIVWHMNHSCEPNIGFDDKDNFIAMRPIKRGDELTWDYSFDETNPDFKMKCLCGAKTCRKMITGKDWEFLIRDKRRLKYLSRKLKALARKHNK